MALVKSEENSSQVRAHFESEGYYIYKNAIPMGVIEALRAGLHYHLAHSSPERAKMDLSDAILHAEAEDHALVYNAMKTMGSSLAHYRLFAEADLAGKTTEVTGIPAERMHATLFQTPIQIPKDTRFDFQWHQENGSYSKLPQLTTFWFPILDSARAGYGTMEIIPKSHVDGFRPTRHIVTEGGLNDWIVDLKDGEEEKAITVEIDLGDMICFNADLVHRSSPNKGNRPRVTGIARTADIGISDVIVPLAAPINYNDNN